MLNGQNPANNSTITYHNIEEYADNDLSPINPISTITLATSPKTVWIRVESLSNPNCFDVTSVTIIVNPLPTVSSLPPIVACSSFTLPTITNGVYYTGPNGTGIQLNPNDVIDETATYYIFSGPDANGCTNQSSFLATFMDEYDIELEHCGKFEVPTPLAGHFYTQTGGPNGSGTIIPPGTFITTNQTIYFYVEIDGVFCKEDVYPLIIHPLPPVDTLSNVVTCGSYTLPPLTNGNYFSATGGGGTPFFAGDNVTVSRNVFIFSDDGTCTNETFFQVIILKSTCSR